MESQPVQNDRPVNPRRKRKTKMEIFREVYLPFVIVAVSVLVIVGIIVAIASGSRAPDEPNTSSSSITQLQRQAASLLAQAEELAAAYDYEQALALLNSFEGDLQDFPQIREAIDNYTMIQNSMVTWQASQVPNLSFHVLVADMKAALADETYGQSAKNLYNRNFISTEEFSAILQQLYDNGYVLVDLSDFYSCDNTDGTFQQKTLQLPAGKKPLLLTETHCSYYQYMAQSHAFASKLCYNGNFYNEMVTADGATVTGSFDLVPLLEDFIRLHPDFSYQGARAILAFSGYDGIFGYRISEEGSTQAAQKEAAATLANALRNAGYTLACYTYGNMDYSVKNAQAIAEDIQQWQELIGSVIGQTDILVFAQESDIGTSYEANPKFDILHRAGFHYFLGSSAILYQAVDDQYVRHNRLMVTGSNLAHHADWFKDMIDTDGLLDSRRGNIPN